MKNVCELPVMKSCCKTCPFKTDDRGRQQAPELASQVVARTLFQGQQICHGTEVGSNREPRNRCRGAFDQTKIIYDRIGQPNLISEEIRKL